MAANAKIIIQIKHEHWTFSMKFELENLLIEYKLSALWFEFPCDHQK